jgi:hypothetical protein
MAYEGPDGIAGAVVNLHEQDCKQYSDLATTLQAAEGDREAAVKQWAETADDAQAEKLRAGIAKLNAQLHALAEKSVSADEMSDEDKAKIREQLDSLGTKIRNGRNAAVSVAKTTGVDVEGIQKYLDDNVPDPTRRKGAKGSANAGTGSSLPKASVNFTLVKGDERATFDTFTLAAKHMDTTVEKLQLAYAEAASKATGSKVEHADISSVTRELSFTFGDYSVNTKPKARKKPGPRPGNKAPAVPADKQELPAA